MILFQAPQHRFAVCYRDVMRSVVADEYEILIKIERMEFREASAYAEPVHYKHGDTRFQIEFAAHPSAFSSELPTVNALTSCRAAESGRPL